MKVPSSSTDDGTGFRLTVVGEQDDPTEKLKFREHVIAGLTNPTKALSSIYLYDDRGSELYAKITDLEEYYVTESEREIFESYANDMVTTHFCPRNARRNETINIVELGAGDGRKTRILLNALISHRVKFEYIPIDISRKAMTNLFRSMDKAFPKNTLNIHGLIGKYVECLRYIILQHPSRENVVAFIGSSIGNFTGQQASHFLQKLRAQMKPRDVLLLGTDLRKDARVMQKAYSDSKGITREFNLNLLIRLNRELGTNFDLKKFEHVADYNPEIGAMESFLVCNEAHCISMATTESGSRGTTTSHDFMFKQFERIHMEYSHKFTPELVSEMLQIAGYQVKDQYFDNRHWFTDTISVVPDNQHSGAHPENAIHSGFLDMENIQ